MSDFIQQKIAETEEIIPVRQTINGIKIRMGREYAPFPYANGDKARLLTRMVIHYLQTRDKSFEPTVIGGMSSGSPYQPMCASLCKALSDGLGYKVNNIFCNSSHSSKGKEYLEIAESFGARHQNEGINGQGKGLQTKIKAFASTIPGSMYVPYAITPDVGLGKDYFAEMYEVGARQVKALAGTGVKKIYIPFGSANSSTSMVYGLNKYIDYHAVEEIVFVCVAANAEKQKRVLESNLRNILDADTGCAYDSLFGDTPTLFSPGRPGLSSRIKMSFFDTSKEKKRYGQLAWDYSQLQHEKFELLDGTVFDHHPRYEGKAWAKMRELWPEELENEENMFWEVGGPLLP